MHSKPLFIYIDVGGVLIDWSRIFITAEKKFHISKDDIWAVFNETDDGVTKGVISPQQLWEKCVKKYKLSDADDYDFLESLVSGYRPITVMHDLVTSLKDTYKIGLLSNIYKGMLPLLLRDTLLPNIDYTQIIFSCDVGMKKPKPAIYEFAQCKADTAPNNILFIDDRQDFLEIPIKIGWQTFLFNSENPNESVSRLKKYLI